jgi:hypothetical protein
MDFGKVRCHQPKLPNGHTESLGLETLGRCSKETEFCDGRDTMYATDPACRFDTKALHYLTESSQPIVAFRVVFVDGMT